MKILTLCSNPFVSLKPVTQLLQVAGLPEGINSLEDNKSYDQWHEQVFDAYEQDCSGLHMSEPLKPGKVWQDMAGQLIQANLSKKQWYWTDSRAGWLLDFWLEIEPQHRFALIYSPPQTGISQCLLQVDEQNASIEIAIKSWINYHFELLRFYRHHQDKCILVNLQRCLSYPGEFLQICKQHLGLDIDEQVSLESLKKLNESFGIEELLFQFVVKQYPEITNLFQELEASATPFESQINDLSVTQVNGNEQLANICQDYRKLKIQRVDDVRAKTQLQHELETHKLTIEKLETEKKLQNRGFKKSFNGLEEAKAVLEKKFLALQNEVKQYKQKNTEHEQENGLMLLQLSQVREEFEAFFLKTQKLESEQAEEKQALLNEIKQSKQNIAETVQENELILLQLHQVQEELEVAFLKAQKIESDKVHEIAVLEKQIQTLTDEVKQCKEKSAEYEKENRLMFLRVHQIQDELENYFKKYQKLECNMQSNNMIACIEQQQDSAATSLVHAQFIQVKNEDDFEVDLINLQWQGQVWPRYHLQIIKSTLIDEKIITPAGIKLPLQANNLLPIKTWPPQTADEQGAYWMIDENLLSIEQEHSHFYPEDIAFLHALVCQLPEWLKLLESSTGVKNNQWEYYFQVIEGLQAGLKQVFKLQDS